MTFSQSISSVFNQYANFSGRASRSQYWYFVLFNFLIGCVLGFIEGLTGGFNGNPSVFWSVISTLVSLALTIPSLAVAVRRMHDIGRGGGWIFITLIPLIGWIWFIVLCCTPSDPSANRFGNVPA